MSNILLNLSRYKKNKSDIKEVIEKKLRTSDVSNDLADWSELIDNIYDYQKYDTDVDVECDDYTHIYLIPVNNSSNYSFQINPTGETTVDWGDGTVDTLTTTGLQFAYHAYTSLVQPTSTNKGVGAYGYTHIHIKIHSEYPYSFEGQGATANTNMTGTSMPAFNNMGNAMTKFIAANNATVGKCGFSGCAGLQYHKLSPNQTVYDKTFFYCNTIMFPFNIPSGVTTLTNGAFQNAIGLIEVNIPDTVTTIDTNVFNGCTNLRTLEIPSSVTSIGTGICSGCRKLRKVVWKSPYKFIGSSSFATCYNLEILDLSNATEQMYFGTSTSTTGSNSYIPTVQGFTKIIVPKNLYNSWKSNIRWLYFTDYLYWRDEDGTLKNTTVE